MSRAIHKLTDRMVRQTKKPGLYADGGGLFLQVTLGADDTPRRSWVVRVRAPSGKVREMGLGGANDVPLEKAREKAREARWLARDGVDPIEHQKAERKRAALEAARAITFEVAAETYIKTHEGSWKNEKHRQQWRSTLKTYVYPVFGSTPVGEIDGPLVMKVLDPLWDTKTETASRIRGRIETILDWATVRGYRDAGDNPARWRGHLQRALPPRSKVQKVTHHAALPYKDLPAFMVALAKHNGPSARALEFVILTGARTGEALGATWDEVDLANRVWTIPAARMKAGREHRVPLTGRALQILLELDNLLLGNSNWVFSAVEGKALSSMALLMMLRRMKRSDITAHGFRSTFRDWAAEETIHTREVAEAALAHASGDKVERAYQRGDFFEKRRLLMGDWNSYATGKSPQNKATKRPKHTKLEPKQRSNRPPRQNSGA